MHGWDPNSGRGPLQATSSDSPTQEDQGLPSPVQSPPGADSPPETTPAPEDPNEYAYVVNKFGRLRGSARWNAMAVTDYLPARFAVDWINADGPRA
jgi:hypothetical protein